MTIYEAASKGDITSEMMHIAKNEQIDIKTLVRSISKGKTVIMKRNGANPIGIGFPLRTKINVNIGTSTSEVNVSKELEKIKVAEKLGADTISDLSMGGEIDEIRKKILEHSTLPITTVPIYQSVIEAGSISDLSEDIILNIIEKQLKDGISSIVIHTAFSLADLISLKGKRIMGIVSKGGSFTATMMKDQGIENPFLKNFDHLMDLLREYDTVLNLGNAMRSGCIHDKLDEFQFSELKVNSQLAKRANKSGIQVIIESLGGHIMAKELIKSTRKYKKVANNRPLFVAGPLPTDFAPGYDHIVASVGGAFASGFGADYLCAITPAEHLCLPTVEDVKKGVIACRIAAHVGDSLKFGLNYLFKDDYNVSKFRFEKNWQKQFEYSIDPEEPSNKHPINEDVCSMCGGKYCALALSKRIFEK